MVVSTDPLMYTELTQLREHIKRLESRINILEKVVEKMLDALSKLAKDLKKYE